MAATPESKVKAKARKLYQAGGHRYIQTVLGLGGRNGTPDQQVCRSPDGHFGDIETKAGTWRVTDLQRIELSKTAAAGGSSMVINERNLDMLAQWLGAVGWKVNAVFDEKSNCTHHVAARIDGVGEPQVIKNPGPIKKPGKSQSVGP